MFPGRAMYGVREKSLQLGDERPIRPVLEARGQDRRQLEVVRQVAEREHVVLEIIGREVADDVAEAGLVVDQKHGSFGLVETTVLEFVLHDQFPGVTRNKFSIE